jgi:multidrug efflux system membrane fusion protein
LVHRGQSLIQIDPRPFQANVLTAQGALERDTNLLAQAEMDLKRYQDAWARNAIPKQTLDDQEKARPAGPGDGQSRPGNPAVRPGATGFTNITSPITGRVGLRLVDPGNLATASSSTPLAVVTQLQPITVVFTIPEDNVSQLQQQMRKARRSRGCPGSLQPGQAGLRKAGSYRQPDRHHDRNLETARALRQQRQRALSQPVRECPVAAETLQNVVLIPSSTIQHNGDTAYVFLIQNNVAHIHNIKPGVSEASG